MNNHRNEKHSIGNIVNGILIALQGDRCGYPGEGSIIQREGELLYCTPETKIHCGSTKLQLRKIEAKCLTGVCRGEMLTLSASLGTGQSISGGRYPELTGRHSLGGVPGVPSSYKLSSLFYRIRGQQAEILQKGG